MNSIKTLCATLCLLGALLVCPCGCTYEDFSECAGAEIRFSYTKHTYGGDRFADEVHQITLYVFDSKNLYVGSYSDQGSPLLDKNYVMPVDLKPGKYSFVVWGNLCDHFDITPFVVGQTRLNEALLSFNHPEESVNDCLSEALFHGEVINTEIRSSSSGKPKIMIDLTKNTNAVHVIITTLEESNDPGRTPPPTPEFTCVITSDNAIYKFDNSLVGSIQRLYKPQYVVQGNKTISNFIILRELKDGSTGSRLILTRHLANGTSEEVSNVALVPLLLSCSKTGDLDIDDDYTLNIDLEQTGSTVTVTINGWVVPGGGGGVVG